MISYLVKMIFTGKIWVISRDGENKICVYSFYCNFSSLFLQ